MTTMYARIYIVENIWFDPTVLLNHPTMGSLETSTSSVILNNHRADIFEVLISHSFKILVHLI